MANANKRDYYEVLGVQKGAGDDEIKKGYRKLAKQYHPDLNPGDKTAEEKMKEVNEAYEVLSNPDKKSRYDQFGHAGVDPSYGGGGFSGGFSGGFGGMGGFDDISEIFGNIFGGGFTSSSRSRNPNAPRRGADISAQTEIDFLDAVNGKSVQIKYNRAEPCPDCNGSGSSDGNSQTCPDCKGTGTVKVTQRTPFGVISSESACPKCGGKGKIIASPCRKCNGSGRVTVPKTLNVDIPAGIDNGQTIQIAGKGAAGVNNGPYGDLHIRVSVRPDPIFERDGFDIHTEMPITYSQAVLGDELTVPTVDGNVKYKIPEGTQSGTIFRLRSKGIKRLNRSDRGDHYVHVIVEIPAGLNTKQKEALSAFESTLTDQNYKQRTSFYDKIKRFFKGN
ncbi:MAG: molecular chaperone DnaJ [Ruminococcus sp.]|jgi:molecular chaperone DnaJ|nr:molecular chaperone DnaJ [Ruminococcus sp.]